jgi:hypothetical protein
MTRLWIAVLSVALVAGSAAPAGAGEPTYKGRAISELMSSGGRGAWRARAKSSPVTSALVNPSLDDGNPWLDPDAPLAGFPSLADEGGDPGPTADDGRNVFVNDPCLDPPPPSRRRTVQSETELAVLNSRHSHGKKIVVGYNDSYGFYDNRQGLSGYSYSIDGGRTFIDGGGLPPAVPAGLAAGTPGQDSYFGDPVVVVHNRSETFYYSSIYLTPNGFQTLSVNRGHFQRTPPRGSESRANTRCAGNPSANGTPDPPPADMERIVWEPPVVAVSEAELGGGPNPDPNVADALDKEWLYVDQRTGVLYLSFTRFGIDGSTPIEMVRSYDGGTTWTPPSVIVPNLNDTFNQATQPVVTSSGRVVVTWHARIFSLVDFSEIDQQIQAAWSDNDGISFGPSVTVTHVNPQREPRGYNRGRSSILNAPYLVTDRRGGDGEEDEGDDDERGRGTVYVTYFDGKTPLSIFPYSRQADIKVSRSRNGGATWDQPVKVNDDLGNTSHVFPSIQVDRHHQVHAAWTDRRLDQANNVLTDIWAAASRDAEGLRFGGNTRVTNVSTSWFQRADARPNFGDYNSSELIGDQFVTTWADGRFPPGTYIPPTCTPAPPPGHTCPPTLAGTPDTFFAVVPDGEHDEHGGD